MKKTNKPHVEACQQNLFEVDPITPPPKPRPQNDDSFVFDIMDAMTAPIITFSMAWADCLPQRLLDIIPEARLMALMKGERKATYPECMAYMYTRVHEAPMHLEWAEIYLHVGCTITQHYFKRDDWDALHAKRQLDQWHQSLLNRLQTDIYESRREALRKRGRPARPEETPDPHKATPKKTPKQPPEEQPSLF